MTIETILQQRGNRYGEFTDNASISQQLKDIIIHGKNYPELNYTHIEALHNIFQKIARIVNGDPNYIENWKDIIGYSQLVINELMQTDGATDGKVIPMIVRNKQLVPYNPN